MYSVAFFLLAVLSSSVLADCERKTEDGDCCIFPFTFSGVEYNGCTTVDWDQEWCSTTENYDIDQQWGNCAPVCERKTEDGDCCKFPFIFNDVEYNGCTSVGWDREWCSTTENYDIDQQWGNCAGSNCGSKPAGSRIVGGAQAFPGEWPWQTMLASPGGSQFCGGSLIKENWVLTASHCVQRKSASHIVVRLGAHKITDIGQEIEVEKIIMHQSYNSPVQLAHDIALLKLKKPATLGQGVGLVCLPDVNNHLAEGKRCYITGWGTLASGGNQPEYLQEASVPIVSQARCKAAYGAAIHDSMFCAGLDAGGVDACQGDSGGPMVCEFGRKWYLEGVTSWGHGCATPNKFGVYASMRYLKSWVESKMATNRKTCLWTYCSRGGSVLLY